MDASMVLGHLTSLTQLPAFVATLGHSPAWQELPPDILGVPAETAALVGSAGTFEWLGFSADGAELLGRRLSGTLSSRGRTAGVLALDPKARTLTIAITMEQCGLLTLPLPAPAPGQLERLHRLILAGNESGIRYALRAVEVLTGEDAGRRFFAAFRAALENMADSLPGPLTGEDRRALALVQLTRVLFLYFVQAKGWLDGRPDFLRAALDDGLARRRRLHRDLFRPLFFGTLNRERHSRGRARCFGRIPFLNGGLFEPHPLERAWTGEVPDHSWRDSFDQVFERFRFTVHEGSEPGQIAPDMLGRVFEGLMAPDERRASGAFYTPARLVARLVDSGLVAWLGQRLNCPQEEAARRLERREPAVTRFLASITVLDPAVGSGAFLLGLLDRLAELRLGELPPAALRRRILQDNLFGVDRNPMAVRLAELRLWLAVIAREETSEPELVAPLPNLDGVVRQGDSLLDPAWFLAGLDSRPLREGPELAGLRQAFVTASGREKRECARRLRQGEVRVLMESLARAAAVTERELAELLQSARSRTLFGDRRGLDAPLRHRLRQLRARQREIRGLERRLRREGSVPWFRYECHFGDVSARGGFDMVVGNPPWIRAEELPQRERTQLARRYRWWRGTGRGFAHQPDLAVAFVERGLELLAPGGVLVMLVPAKVATAAYGARLRAELAARNTLLIIADLSNDPAAAFAATTYPALLVAAKASPRQSHTVGLSLEPRSGERIPQERLLGGGPWVLASPALLEVVAELRARCPRLGERFTPQLGVKTGANALYLEPPSDLEPAVLRTGLRGRDAAAFTTRGAVRLFFPHDERGEPFARLPPRAAAYVRSHEALLRARVDYQGGPVWTLFRVRPAVAPHRVVWPDLARRLSAVALTGPAASGMVPLNSCYVLPVPGREIAHALAAWLNTTWLRATARAVADAAASGFARYNARIVSDLPLPATVLDDPRLPRLAERGALGEPVQEELDAVAAEHLALPRQSRAILAAAPGTGSDHRGRGAGRPA